MKKIFPCALSKLYNNCGEFQLTTCLDQLCQVEGMTGYVMKGKCFDTGLPDAYRQTLIDFRL
jgi:UTP--glucose-1-phosphate uridylyltransferase